MLEYVSRKRHIESARFWVRAVVVLLMLSALVPATFGNPPAVSAADCPHWQTSCLVTATWEGATLGAATKILVTANSCGSYCAGNTFSQSIKVRDNSRLPFGPAGWIEAGYHAINSNTYWYFWCNTSPGSDTWCSNPGFGPIPAGDFGNFTLFKITRNRQGEGKVLVQFLSGGNPQFNWTTSPPLDNTMGGKYGTTNAFLGTSISLTNRVVGDSGPYTITSADYIHNYWQQYDGIYNFQTTRGDIWISNDVFYQSWVVDPAPGGTGGVWRAWCCYY